MAPQAIECSSRRRRWTLRQRGWLLGTLAVCQIVCVLACTLWFSDWLARSIAESRQADRIILGTQMLATVSAALAASAGPPAEPHVDSQRLCELMGRFGGPGALSIQLVDEHGAPVCGDDPPSAAAAGAAGAWRIVQRIPGRRFALVADGRGMCKPGAGLDPSDRVRRVGYVFAVLATLLSVGALMGLHRRYECQTAADNQRLEHLVAQRTRSLMRTREAIIFGLARLAESRDVDTGEHLERIRQYTELLAGALAAEFPELTPQTIQRLGIASSLHDIGKVGVPDQILRKPGRLCPEERQAIQQHTLIGGDCLFAIKQRLGEEDFLELACEIAYGHHERWDGAGYPYGLAREAVPLSARIVALADVYDALTSPRVYKPAYSHETARQIILSESGKQFDPRIVAAFERTDHEFAAISRAAGPHPVQAAGPAAVQVAV